MFDQLDLLDRIAFYIPVLLSLTVHEWAHAWTAWKLGDDTARMLGRVSLNPLVHLDPIGTLLPLLGVPFGWARPVPINPVRFRSNISMSLGILLTAAAGPISNLLIAGGCAIVLMTLKQLAVAPVGPNILLFAEVLNSTLLINVVLALFNMLPIPPLDGSRIVDSLMPTSLRPAWNEFSALGPFLLAAVILLPFVGINLLAVPLNWVSKILQPFVF